MQKVAADWLLAARMSRWSVCLNCVYIIEGGGGSCFCDDSGRLSVLHTVYLCTVAQQLHVDLLKCGMGHAAPADKLPQCAIALASCSWML